MTSLMLNATSQSDSGAYECIATTSKETISAVINISVAAPPKNVTHPRKIIAARGERITVDCLRNMDEKLNVSL